MSGLDKLFIEAGVYGSTTLRQILEGKYMKRGVDIYFSDWYKQHEAEFSLFVDQIKQELSCLTDPSFQEGNDMKIVSDRMT